MLALDAPVRRYLPELRLSDEATAGAVTVANLLEHTAGWFSDEVFDDGGRYGLMRYVDPGQITTLRIVGQSLEKSSDLTPAPGAWRPAFAAPPAEPVPVTFTAPDVAVAGGVRIPFVRDDDGSVGWLAEGLRLRPRDRGLQV